MEKRDKLLAVKRCLDSIEEERFFPWACLSKDAIREKEEKSIRYGHRQNFSVDTDRILHSLAFSRYIDKTQVFFLIENDHITHRVLHVQLVSKIGRTLGRILRLNEDLIEAIALGHDIGHTPFGHDGEKFLSEQCRAHGIQNFLHNVQSVRFLQKIEKKGKGWNLTLQVLDGILCHDGELHCEKLVPNRDKGFDTLRKEIKKKENDPSVDLLPMTMEGCIVRMADTISYVGRDIEDAIRLGLIKRKDLPDSCTKILGTTNGTIVYTLVEDLAFNSMDKPYVSFSSEVGLALKRLKRFNEKYIYNNHRIKYQNPKIRLMFELLFKTYLKALETGDKTSAIYSGFLDGMSEEYKETTPLPGIVRDFIAGMTDKYFLTQCHTNLFPNKILSFS
ncbi:MAG: HD domain-containing protein [Deltaproteobacteria bacterium]|nr:HD domain-containing protein [Deltaproteobacteria bacterium]